MCSLRAFKSDWLSGFAFNIYDWLSRFAFDNFDSSCASHSTNHDLVWTACDDISDI